MYEKKQKFSLFIVIIYNKYPLQKKYTNKVLQKYIVNALPFELKLNVLYNERTLLNISLFYVIIIISLEYYKFSYLFLNLEKSSSKFY